MTSVERRPPKTELVLEGFEVRERIHLGSRTRVYRAVRSRDGIPFVLKTTASTAPSTAELRRLQREHVLGSSISDEHVVRYHRLASLGMSSVLLLEDFGGASLRRQIPAGGFSIDTFLSLALQAARAVEAVHRQQIVHKDIKTSNFIYAAGTEVLKLTDFGISTELSREYHGVDNVNRLEGTLAYISPEQTGRMNRPVDYRTDFYSLGVTFYELVAGRLPFLTDDALELVHCHIAKPAPSLTRIRGDLPHPLVALIEKLMAKNAEARYQTARGLISDLERCGAAWASDGRIESFTLGRRDVSNRFQLPHRLYGREAELAELSRIFTEVTHGANALAMVVGYAGVGKSALVGELSRPITATGGFFISGKFDQLNLNIPYSALTPAFRGLVSQILASATRS